MDAINRSYCDQTVTVRNVEIRGAVLLPIEEVAVAVLNIKSSSNNSKPTKTTITINRTTHTNREEIQVLPAVEHRAHNARTGVHRADSLVHEVPQLNELTIRIIRTKGTNKTHTPEVHIKAIEVGTIITITTTIRIVDIIITIMEIVEAITTAVKDIQTLDQTIDIIEKKGKNQNNI